MRKYQGISILSFSHQSKARPRQAVIAKWQTKQWCKKGKISARRRSKRQVQRSVPWVSRVEGLTLRQAPRYRFSGVLLFPAAGAPGIGCAVCHPPFSSLPPPVPFASVCWRALLPAAVLCALCGLGCRAVPPFPSPLSALWWFRALASCCSFGLCCFWRLVIWCVPVCCAVSCGVLQCGTALR